MEMPRSSMEKTLAQGVTAATLVLASACSPSETPPPSPIQQTDPSVAEYVQKHPSDGLGLYTGAISRELPPNKDKFSVSPEDPYSTLVNMSGSSIESASILDVKLGNDGELHYTAAKEMPERELGKILGAVNENAAYLKATMQPDSKGKIAVDSVRFRIFDPSDVVSGFPQTTEMEYKGVDENDEGRSNIYYMLPGQDTVDVKQLTEMIGHENAHAALGHKGDRNWLQREQAARLNAACRIIGEEAVKEVMATHGSNIAANLRFLEEQVDASYKPAYDRVLAALQDGTYTDIARVSGDFGDCEVQHPTQAVMQTLKEQGVDSTSLKQELTGGSDKPNADQIEDTNAQLIDGFNEALEATNVYKPIREASYLTYSADNKRLGHPHDNDREISASTANVATLHPEEFLKKVDAQPTQICAAVKDVLQVSQEVIDRRYPGLPLARDIQAVNGRLTTAC